jgi:murein DD-endopeptidase MepM/ murein hydrolase activator NlpD
MEEFVYSLPMKFRIPVLSVLRVLGELEIFLTTYPRHCMAVVGFVLLGGGGGAYAVANLGPDAALLPVQIVSMPVETLQLQEQATSLDLHAMKLFRSEITRSSDTPESLLRRLAIVDPEAVAFLRKNPVTKDGLGRAGRNISAQANERQQLLSLTTRWLRSETDSVFQRLTIKRTPQGFTAIQETAPLVANTQYSGAVVETSLFAAADEARIPDSVTSQLSEIFSSQIDFHRSLRKGSRFSVVYEALEADGEPLRTGKVLSAEMVNGTKSFQAVWFQESGQKGDYYSLDGKSLKNTFLAAPVRFSRMTSGFGMRVHPLFQTNRAHLGVDYAAATGTPAMSVADGVVEFAGMQSGYGNVVIVKHSPSQSTFYAHLNHINVSKGKSVKQGEVVGTVGSTGWATGPHLHFEFRINGVHVDPLTLARQNSGPASVATRPGFNKMAALARTQLASAGQLRESNVQ